MTKNEYVHGDHTPRCPELTDGDGGTRPCTWWDHDADLANEPQPVTKP